MVTRIIVGVALGPAFLAALFLLPPAALAVVVACIAGMASFELLRCAKVAHHNGMYIFTALAAALIHLGYSVNTTDPEEIREASTRSSVSCFRRGALLSRMSIYPLAGSSWICRRFSRST